MRRRNLYVLAACVLAAAVGFWLWKCDVPRKSPSLPRAFSPIPASPSNIGTQPVEHSPAAATADGFDVQKLNPRHREYLAEYQRPINFYGIVVDQDRNPIEGARIYLSPSDNPVLDDSSSSGKGKDSEYWTKSDAQGRFSVIGMHGPRVYVEAEREGYYRVDKRSFATFVHEGGDSHMGWRLLPEGPENPALLVLRKKGEPAALIRVPHRSVIVGKNGRTVDISLGAGEAVASGQGDIRVEMWVDAQNTGANQQYDWRCRISVPGGGLQVRRDDFEFTAPEEGYQTEEVIEQPKTLPRDSWDTDAFRHYFIKTGAGNYARVRIRLITRNSGSCVIEESYLNPAGSPNLEYDPQKQAAAR